MVALLGDEATVKRLYKDADRVRLQPAHPSMQPIIVTKPQTVAILGKVVAVFRTMA